MKYIHCLFVAIHVLNGIYLPICKTTLVTVLSGLDNHTKLACSQSVALCCNVTLTLYVQTVQ